MEQDNFNTNLIKKSHGPHFKNWPCVTAHLRERKIKQALEFTILYNVCLFRDIQKAINIYSIPGSIKLPSCISVLIQTPLAFSDILYICLIT